MEMVYTNTGLKLMKEFNITAQVYCKEDSNKQTLLINQTIEAKSKDRAVTQFYGQNPDYEIIKVYSAEEIYGNKI
jgi:hypothetical protein